MIVKDRHGGRLSLKSAIAFHDEIAGSWSKGYDRGSFNRRLETLKPAISRNVQASTRWMDMGCGSGVLVGELLAQGADVVGVDGAPSMIEHARNAYANDARARFMVSNVTRIAECADRTFDGVLCSSVLEYISEPQSLLHEAQRLLRADGRLIITAAGAFSAVRMMQHVARRCGRVIGRDVFSYLEHSRFTQSAKGMSKMLAQSGFAVDRVESFDPYIPQSLRSILPPAILIIEARKVI